MRMERGSICFESSCSLSSSCIDILTCRRLLLTPTCWVGPTQRLMCLIIEMKASACLPGLGQAVAACMIEGGTAGAKGCFWYCRMSALLSLHSIGVQRRFFFEASGCGVFGACICFACGASRRLQSFSQHASCHVAVLSELTKGHPVCVRAFITGCKRCSAQPLYICFSVADTQHYRDAVA